VGRHEEEARCHGEEVRWRRHSWPKHHGRLSPYDYIWVRTQPTSKHDEEPSVSSISMVFITSNMGTILLGIEVAVLTAVA
jgi:hypothetical protein